MEKSSPERVAPECRYFSACGGCQYQHIDYATQLRVKHKQISDLFERVGRIPADKIAPVIPSPQPYGYRNRIMIRSQWNGPAKKLVIGFIRADNNFVEDIEECKIAEPAISEQIKNVRANPPPKGGIKIVLRIPPENWDVPPDSFFQNNFFLLPKLVETVRGFSAQSAARSIWWICIAASDFSGLNLQIWLNHLLVSNMTSSRSIPRAKYASRKISNGEFISSTVEEVLPELLKKFSPEKTSVILDPPRKGCWPETLSLLRETRPAQVIYVSCHPATMARDLNILCADGVFELARVQPLDMFPQTQHVECVADLRAGQALPNREI